MYIHVRPNGKKQEKNGEARIEGKDVLVSLTFGEKKPSQAPISSYISTRSDIEDICLVSSYRH